MRKFSLITAAILALLSGLAAILPERSTEADAKAQDDARKLAEKSASSEQVNWMLVKDDALEKVAIWDGDGALIYPPPKGMVPLRLDLSEDTLLELARVQRSANPVAWSAFRGSPHHILNCRKEPAVCLVYHRETFEEALSLQSGGLPVPPKTVSGVLAFLAFVSLIAAKFTPCVPSKDLSQKTRLQVFPDRYVAVYGGKEVPLTERDLKVLTTLQDRDGNVVTKDELYNAAWGRDFMPNSRALDQHVITLRRKLDPNKSQPALIETVRGIGYRLVPA
ncbi:MAG: winged helix-turn-helix domain-containing protein [Pseudomonadota bacterium]